MREFQVCQPAALIAGLVLACGGPGSARAGQPELKQWVINGLQSGYLEPVRLTIEYTGNVCNWKLDSELFNRGSSRGYIDGQILVESIRLARSRPEQRVFWEPYLRRMERVIDDWLRCEQTEAKSRTSANWEEEHEISSCYYEIINNVLKEALEENARRKRMRLEWIQPPNASAGPLSQVHLTTSDGKGMILVVPKTVYLIALRLREAPPFKVVPSGSVLPALGDYAYKIRRPDGTETGVRFFQARSGFVSLRLE